jgi:hypothetical protein
MTDVSDLQDTSTDDVEPSKPKNKGGGPQVVEPGPRGIVGVATAACTIKRLWHEATHVLQNIGNSKNPRKQAWIRKAGSVSLKKFARQLAAKENDHQTTAKEFFANKRGAKEQARSNTTLSRIMLEKQASKSARKSKGKSGGSSSTPKQS